MSYVNTQDYSIRHGKMEKKSNVVFRVRNGKQQSYVMAQNTNPPTKAQKAHRAFFGKVNAIVNAIMNDPVQQAEWTTKRLEYNHSFPASSPEKRYTTTRSYVFAVISAELAKNEEKKRRRKPLPLTLPKGYRMIAKLFSELRTAELYEILRARVGRIEIDGTDTRCMHLAVFHKGRVVAYARMRKEGRPSKWAVEQLFNLDPEIDLKAHLLQRAKELTA